MARSGEGRLPVGTMVTHAGDYQCVVERCEQPAPFHFWTGTEFVSACEQHEAEIAALVARSRDPRDAES